LRFDQWIGKFEFELFGICWGNFILFYVFYSCRRLFLNIEKISTIFSKFKFLKFNGFLIYIFDLTTLFQFFKEKLKGFILDLLILLYFMIVQFAVSFFKFFLKYCSFLVSLLELITDNWQYHVRSSFLGKMLQKI
jgi:hypothetical protein